jgi:hypothetical protein
MTKFATADCYVYHSFQTVFTECSLKTLFLWNIYSYVIFVSYVSFQAIT